MGGTRVVVNWPLVPLPIAHDGQFWTRHCRPMLRRAPVVGAHGAPLSDLFRRAASYVDRILKGAKPADLPVEQPTKFDFVVNLKTAKALGITIPPSLMLRVDEVIQ